MKPETIEPEAGEDAEETLAGHAPEALTRVRRKVVVRWADARGNHEVTIADRILVGSAASAAMVVADPTVSRIHAEFVIEDDLLWIRDLGSRNGTFVDGLRVAIATVPNDSRVRVGSTDLCVKYDADPVAVDLWHAPSFGPLVGKSASMRELFAQLARISANDSAVLIRGETGTGKELVARAIHEASRRATQPFVVIDCASLPESLLEAELFGHTKGAFTGAISARVGAFEAAEGGTVFIDEVGELPMSMQPKLLRVLESRTVRRIGENTVRAIDVRVVSATNRDLRRMVNVGAFREDLYFRLAVLPVSVPPLRERVEDIPLLVQHFLPPGASTDHVTPQLFAELANRPWLGNVRELRNFVERMVVLGAEGALSTGSVAPPPMPGVSPSATPDAISEVELAGGFRAFRDKWVERGEREYIRRLLHRHAGNVSEAARTAGVDRTYLYKLMRRHSL